MSNILTSQSQWLYIEVINDISFATLSNFLNDVSYLYPNFSAWLNFTFRRNLSSGQRQIVLAHDQTKIIGICLLKNTASEKKICTYYVEPSYRGLGIGGKLLSTSLELLDSGDSFITVSAERKTEIEQSLKTKGFKAYKSIQGLYREESAEFIYRL